MIYRYDEDMAPPTARTDSTRLFISDQQWLAILERVQRGQSDDHAPPDADDCRRLHERRGFATRCLLRLSDSAGTFVVRSQDLSAGGLRFVHGHRLRPSTRCTIALQPEFGPGKIIAAVVAWSNPIEFLDEDIEAYEIGVKFDQPIDTRAFVAA